MKKVIALLGLATIILAVAKKFDHEKKPIDFEVKTAVTEEKSVPKILTEGTKRNKYGLLGFISLLSFTVFLHGDWVALSWIGFASFFRYFWIEPNKFLVDNLKKCAFIAFFMNLATAVIFALIASFWAHGEDLLVLGVRLGFVFSLFTFTFSITIVEHFTRERR